MIMYKLKSKLKYYYSRSCLRKKNYTFLNALKKKIQLIFQKEYVNVYKCRFGNHYHVGHKMKNEKLIKQINNIPTFTILDLKGNK